MKSVVITGSARGLGYNMAVNFRKYGYNIVLSDLKEENLKEAKKNLLNIEGEGSVSYITCNVSDSKDLQKLMDFAIKEYKEVDIWINNAGVNQPDKAIWELEDKSINTLIDVDLKGTIYGSKIAAIQMIKQGHGAIYNVEGYGSNDAHQLGLNMYSN